MASIVRRPETAGSLTSKITESFDGNPAMTRGRSFWFGSPDFSFHFAAV
jgi:hypothetical protein